MAALVAVISGFFDGGYADERLTAWQKGYQMLLVGSLPVVAGQAAARFRRVWRYSARG